MRDITKVLNEIETQEFEKIMNGTAGKKGLYSLLPAEMDFADHAIECIGIVVIMRERFGFDLAEMKFKTLYNLYTSMLDFIGEAYDFDFVSYFGKQEFHNFVHKYLPEFVNKPLINHMEE
ncbi:MAG: hypothetical protein ACK5ML_11770 [Lachnospiraceae bacterium]